MIKINLMNSGQYKLIETDVSYIGKDDTYININNQKLMEINEDKLKVIKILQIEADQERKDEILLGNVPGRK